MEQHTKGSDAINYVVGAELRLRNILDNAEMGQLLKTIVAAGADSAVVTDENRNVLWAEGATETANKERWEGGKSKTLYHEGEPVGYLFISAKKPFLESHLSGLIEVASVSLNNMIKNTAKRMFTTELHTTVIQQSYEELLETNKRLAASEKKYRELAQSLEQKVQERTAELKMAHARLLQQEKMVSIGQLAAGVAHEINNPIGFIYSNLNTFAKYINNIKEMLEFVRAKSRNSAVEDHETKDLYKKLKIDFILDDVSELIRQSTDGAERIRQIVANLKGFSHIDEIEHKEIDINKELDNTLSVLSHEIKTKSARIVKEYGKIPLLNGNPSLLCQVFLNILFNALQSRDEEGLILSIKTEQRGDSAVISISDNGKGIPPDVQNRIFEPFFTTKDVGKGTGLGLTVAYDVVTHHGGSIEVRSELGKGTTFIITLPLKGRQDG